MANLVKRAVNAIIRPPRKSYDLSGIPQFLQGDDETIYIRKPLEFVNKRKMRLVGSYYHSSEMNPTDGGPCVIYLHGNASSQLEGQFLVPNLCRYGIYVFCFDFAGCGCSEGKYVSLGYYEKEDTEFLIDHLRTQFNLGPFILWGRSMGAATALLVDNSFVCARISDSSFTSVADMCSSIAKSMHLPSFFVPASLWILKKQVIKRAKFDMDDVSPISINRENELPALFGHSENDQFIPFVQCQKLYKHYQTRDKYIMALDGGHNSKRSEEWISFGVRFIFEVLDIHIENPIISTCRRLQEKVFHFSSFSAMMDANGENEGNCVNELYLACEEEEKKEKKKKKNKRKSKKLSNSYLVDDGCNKKKRRRSLRLKKLDLKRHNKKNKKHKKNSDNDDDDDENPPKFIENEIIKSNSDINKNENYSNEKQNDDDFDPPKKVHAKTINYNKFILGESSSSDRLADSDNDSSKSIDDSPIKPKVDAINYNKFILGESSSSERLNEVANENVNDSPIKPKVDAINYNKFILGESSSSERLNEIANENVNDSPIKPKVDTTNYNKFILGDNENANASSIKTGVNNSSSKEDITNLINYNKIVLGEKNSSDLVNDNSNIPANET